uniref:tRNA-splicing endonuclease subunit Sen15 domain-containing protein n=1 Tax=Timema tahoe TaxID=61484 RepID=A0A7R9FKC1_9NEOP|nr:unnamed protein product [Timema tahoe]
MNCCKLVQIVSKEADTPFLCPSGQVQLEDMITLGCKRQQTAALALQIYIELCEVQALWNVEYFYSQELDIIYLTGKKKQSSTMPEIYVPVSATADITPEWIEQVQNILCKDKEIKGVTLAIKEQDSSIVYYQITQALVPPDSPETAKRRKIHEDRHRCLEGELRRRRQELFNQAQESS